MISTFLMNIIFPYISHETFCRDKRVWEMHDFGAYGTVYTVGSVIIKQISHDQFGSISKDAFKELIFYATLDHPCIMKPLAWSVCRRATYIMMPRGTPITDAYDRNLITQDALQCDLLSAVEYLNRNGVAHCDIKPNNIVFHNGRTKLIDFGLARYATWIYDSTTDIASYHIHGIAYTGEYRAPDYRIPTDSQKVHWNNAIVSEIYATIQSINAICKSTIEYPIRVTTEPKLTVKREQHHAQSVDALHYILEICVMYRFSAQTVFAATHLHSRLNGDSVNIRIACVKLAAFLCEEYATFDSSDIQTEILHILVKLDCNINQITNWHAARYAEDLPLLFYETPCKKYIPKLHKQGKSKNISALELLYLITLMPIPICSFFSFDRSLRAINPVIIKTCI